MPTTPTERALLQHARLALRSARRAFAAAIASDDARRTRRAAWRLLCAGDHLRALAEHPSRRDDRALKRWRRWALAALRNDPPAAGLSARVRRMMATDRLGAAGACNHEESA